MPLFLAEQLASHPVINRQQITTANGNTLYPSQQIWTVYKPNNDKRTEPHTAFRNSNNFTP